MLITKVASPVLIALSCHLCLLKFLSLNLRMRGAACFSFLTAGLSHWGFKVCLQSLVVLKRLHVRIKLWNTICLCVRRCIWFSLWWNCYTRAVRSSCSTQARALCSFYFSFLYTRGLIYKLFWSNSTLNNDFRNLGLGFLEIWFHKTGSENSIWSISAVVFRRLWWCIIITKTYLSSTEHLRSCLHICCCFF